MPILECHNITYCKSGRKIIPETSFRVSMGSIFGIRGQNGSGKTTLVKIILGLIEPTSGKVVVNNPVKKSGSHNVFYFPQDPINTGYFTTYESLLFHAGINRRPIREIDHVISYLEINHLKKSRARKLSIGEKKRVLLAKALLQAPTLIAMDEPSSGGDKKLRLQIQNTIKRLISLGSTVLLVSHDSEELEFCDEVLDLKLGEN